MITDAEIKEVVRKSIRSASGKGMNEAVDVISYAIIDAMKDKILENVFSVQPDPLPPPIVSSPDVTPARPVPGGELKELKTVVKHIYDVPQAARKRRSLEDIHTIVEALAPGFIEVTPEGWDVLLPLNRIMSNDQQAGSFMLAYQPNKIDPGTPYPKVWFWTTDTDPPDVAAAVEQIKAEAVKMYRKRTRAITTVVKDMGPISQRMAAREEV